MCCHTEIKVSDQTFYHTQSQYTDTGPTSPSPDPVSPGTWQGSHWSANWHGKETRQKTHNSCGLKIHKGKTKYMTNHADSEDIPIDQQKIEKVTQFKYLGQNTLLKDTTKEVIYARIRAAWSCFGKNKEILQGKQLPTSLNLLGTMRHFCGFAGPPRCATFVALHMSHCELCKCKWESFMTNQNICCDSTLASSLLADAESYFWIDFLQGESVVESGSNISHYFRTYFSLYVVPRGLTRIRRKNCIKQPCIFQFCQFLTWCKTTTF